MNNSRLREYLRRHHQWLTLIGALIVFLTFLVNDVLRERLKEMASSIAYAQDVLSIRTDIQRLRDWTRSNQELLINQIRFELAGLGPSPKGPMSVVETRPE